MVNLLLWFQPSANVIVDTILIMMIQNYVKVSLLNILECSKKCATCKNDDKYYCLSCNSLTILTGSTC